MPLPVAFEKAIDFRIVPVSDGTIAIEDTNRKIVSKFRNEDNAQKWLRKSLRLSAFKWYITNSVPPFMIPRVLFTTVFDAVLRAEEINYTLRSESRYVADAQSVLFRCLNSPHWEECCKSVEASLYRCRDILPTLEYEHELDALGRAIFSGDGKDNTVDMVGRKGDVLLTSEATLLISRVFRTKHVVPPPSRRSAKYAVAAGKAARDLPWATIAGTSGSSLATYRLAFEVLLEASGHCRRPELALHHWWISPVVNLHDDKVRLPSEMELNLQRLRDDCDSALAEWGRYQDLFESIRPADAKTQLKLERKTLASPWATTTRVFSPGSGQTRKPGSHRDGRGHN